MNEETIISLVLKYFWPLISIASVMTLTQMFKAVIKHFCTKMDKFIRTSLIFLFAIVTGYFVTLYFMDGVVDDTKWAGAVAILNPVIYELLLMYAAKNKWMGLLALLKMRSIVKRKTKTYIEEKVTDSKDHTVAIRKRRREDDDDEYVE